MNINSIRCGASRRVSHWFSRGAMTKRLLEPILRLPAAAAAGCAAALALVRRAWLRALAFAATCSLVAAGLALAQEAAFTASADSVKAAYLFKLPAYVDWPPQRFERADSPLIVGVLAADDVAEALAALTAGRTSNGRPVVVRRLRLDDELAGVHVLFVGDAARERAEEVGAQTAAQNVLTVADLEAGSAASVIDFVIVNGRVRFEVRLDTAERHGLRLHAGLLNVAARVYGARR